SLYNNRATVEAIATFSTPDGGRLHALAGQGGQLRLWDASTARTTRRQTDHSGGINAICTIRDERGMDAVVTRRTHRTIRVAYPRVAAAVHADAGPGLALCTLPGDPAVVAVAGGDGTLAAWDLAARRRVRGLVPGNPGPLRTLLLLDGDPTSRGAGPAALVSGGQDGTIRLWDVGSWLPAGEPVPAHVGWVWSVCALRALGLLASAGADGLVRL